ncbi:hypothetical protein KDX38_27545 [Pseudomonas sp. CDFA 602]|uniref:hypothetical protein n=1 Tax=Pseudomonas californiensis TaxID=2829823 RepID=UPI001E5E41E0|nr:hypothetical protein [Pseudomonas californiensis]MCD5997316.1 hypothetical protein [Pseudomonas californiensis]MCD6002917.1 hypothetical protein [Pseudomonas californiensis]
MPDPVDLDALLAHVKDEDSFIRFIEALGDDFASGHLLDKASPSSPYGPGSLGWENMSIDAFLEAAAAWAAASNRVLRSDDSPDTDPAEKYTRPRVLHIMRVQNGQHVGLVAPVLLKHVPIPPPR